MRFHDPGRRETAAMYALFSEIESAIEHDNPDVIDDSVLTHCMNILGFDRVATILSNSGVDIAHWDREPPTAAPVPAIAERPVVATQRSRIEQFILDHCRGAYEIVEALFRELSWRLEPAVLGQEDMPSRPPTGIHATRVRTCTVEHAFQSARIYSAECDVVTNDDQLVPYVSASLDMKTSRCEVHVDVDAFLAIAANEAGRIVYLKGRGQILEKALNPELIVLWRPAPALKWKHPHPADFVRHGHPLEGCLCAIADGWTDEELLAIQALSWPKQRKMLEDEAAVVSGDDASVLEFWMGALDARQLAVYERIQNLFT